METFWETLCKYIDTRAKNVSEKGEQVLLVSDKEDTNKSFDKLDFMQQKLHYNMRHKLSECCGKYFIFVTFLLLILLSIISLFLGNLWNALTSILFCISGIVHIRSNKKTTNGNLMYTSNLKLYLWLWKIPPYDDDMANPRCIFIRCDKQEALSWEELVADSILSKLKQELGITNLRMMKSILKRAQYSEKNFQEYWFLNGPSARCYFFYFWIYFHSILGSFYAYNIFFEFMYYIPIILWIYLILSSAALCKFIYITLKSTDENLNIRETEQLIDAICRHHRIRKKESIFFSLVINSNKTDILTEIPSKYRRYFKFAIYFGDEYLANSAYLKYDHIISVGSIGASLTSEIAKQNGRDDLLRIALQCVRDQKLKSYVPKPSFCSQNGLDFLSSLITNNDRNKNRLSDVNILFSICEKISISSAGDCNILIRYLIHDTWFEAQDSLSHPLESSCIEIDRSDLITKTASSFTFLNEI